MCFVYFFIVKLLEKAHEAYRGDPVVRYIASEKFFGLLRLMFHFNVRTTFFKLI